ncbi:MAG: PQQ-binding-like beta-propeller repeat protein [Pirellulaceae bacterium]
MQERATQFIDILETEGLLSPEIVEELRRQVRESKTRLKPELLAKLLVDNGHLTKFQATKLVSEMSEEEGSDSADAPESEEELTFADSAPKEPETKSNEAKIILDDDDSGSGDIVDTVPVVESVEAMETVEVVQAVQTVSPSESLPGNAFDDVEADTAAAALDSVDVPKPTSIRKPATAQSNPWDSFRILGVGLILSLVLIAGYLLVTNFFRGNADTALENAEKAYEQRSYETAASMYSDFANDFPTHEQASFGRVRSGLAAIRKDIEGAPNPTIGLRTALEVLPTITEEEALNQERNDLAGALVSLATKFNERADSRTDITERKELMDEMGKLMEMIEDPKFVGQAQRNQQAPTLAKIGESRARILREINRDEQLTIALAAMDTKLAEQNTPGAYQVRQQLIDLYPLLETNPEVEKRVLQASEIQRELVASGSLNPAISRDALDAGVGNNYLTTNTSGGTAPDLDGRVLFIRAKGSVYGVDGNNGEVLWRKLVGRSLRADPIMVNKNPGSDAIVVQPEQGIVTRVDARSGDTKWSAMIGIPIHPPVIEGQDLYVATLDGNVLSFDLASGQVIWNQQLPQTIAVAPGISFGKDFLYVPGDHTNLYVLSRSDGSCQAVQYTGHQPGSIKVEPILLLGHLFLFENRNNSEAKIRIFTVDKRGVISEEAQVPIAVEGNVVVRPAIDRRRMVVLSDLGQLLALDIETTADSDKVSKLATRAKNVLSPQISWLAAENNKLWVADNRLTRVDLQVTMGKLDGAWSKHDGDLFAGAPLKYGETIVHVRRVRGNRGIRIAAAKADSGEGIWETDVAIPVTSLLQSDGRVAAVNSSAMSFVIQGAKIQTKAGNDPGKGKPQLDFSSSVQLANGGVVLFNASRPNQFASIQNGRTRLLSANFGGAQPSCKPAAVGNNVAIGLSNGQFILVNPENGALASSPYQLPMKAGSQVTWSTPVYNSTQEQLLVASDLKKLSKLTVGTTLRAIKEIDLEAPVKGDLALTGNAVIAVLATNAGDELTFFDSDSLQELTKAGLKEAVVSGPHSVGSQCLLQTTTELIAFSDDGAEIWRIPFSRSPILNKPIESDGDILVSTVEGDVWLLESNGTVIGNLNAGQALSSAPILLRSGVLVGSDEGAVVALPKPTEETLPAGGLQ